MTQVRELDAATTAELRIAALEKRYGSFTALKPTDLSVARGEFLTLLGPSGSGKTTLLMIVAGLLFPTSGEIYIGGERATLTPPHLRDIGVVFQNYALFPHLTVFENVAFPLRMRRTPAHEIKTKVGRVLEIVNLPEMSRRFPAELSGGQQQRVALARCAVYSPSIILMDEPLGALDKKLRETMQLEIRRLHRALGSTIIYVTHDQGEAMSMSDRICLMRNGSVEQLGTPQDLYFRPHSRFVGDFFGGTNFLRATIVDASNNIILAKGPGDSEFCATAAESVGARKIGEPIEVMIRPQHVRLSDSRTGSRNCVDGIVEEIVVTGVNTEYHARLPGGQTLTALELTTKRSQSVGVGDRTYFSWSAEDVVIFGSLEEGNYA